MSPCQCQIGSKFFICWAGVVGATQTSMTKKISYRYGLILLCGAFFYFLITPSLLGRFVKQLTCNFRLNWKFKKLFNVVLLTGEDLVVVLVRVATNFNFKSVHNPSSVLFFFLIFFLKKNIYIYMFNNFLLKLNNIETHQSFAWNQTVTLTW